MVVKNTKAPIACINTFSVFFDGKVCPLGNTKEFRFVWLLCQNSPAYVSHNEFADVVWDGVYDSSLIKNMKHRVVKKLRKAKMVELVERFESTAQHYRLRR